MNPFLPQWLYRRMMGRPAMRNPWRKTRDRSIGTRVAAPPMACATLLEPSYEEGGWLNYVDKTPRQDLVLQFKRAWTAERLFTAVPRELPENFNVANLYWRLTGIAKEQIEAARRHRLAMDLFDVNRGTVGA
jgi:hypothetical protein